MILGGKIAMTNDQKKAVRMAVEFLCGGSREEPKNGDTGKGLVLDVLNLPRSGWPSDGFPSLARQIMSAP